MTLLPMVTGIDAVIHRYADYGPLVAAFLANILATFGDKGQLVVFTLASQYDAKQVFLGAMGAFTLWSAVEVILGQWIVSTLPGGIVSLVTGGLFLLFGFWTLAGAFHRDQTGRFEGSQRVNSNEIDVGILNRVLADSVIKGINHHDGVLTSFVFILFAEFGDKTQLLTMNLAATFPKAPEMVFFGVVSALALRTGIDAYAGERFERAFSTKWIEFGAAGIFVAFGLSVFGLIPPVVLIVTITGILVLLVANLLTRHI